MLTSTFKFSFLLCLWFSLNVAAKETLTEKKTHSDRNEKHASDLLENATAHMQHIWNRKRELFFSTTKRDYHNEYNEEPINNEINKDYRHLLYNLANDLSTIPITEIKNQTLRRQIKLLSKLQLYGLDSEDFGKVREKIQKIDGFLTNRIVCPYNRNHNDCGNIPLLSMLPNIKNKILQIHNLDELNYYWKKWREAIRENNARKIVEQYMLLFRKAAALNGHVTPSRTWYLGYESENFQRELEDIIWEIMPLYKELHAYLRYIARQAYGEQITDDEGAIPASIMEQLIDEAWFAKSILITPYPELQLPAVKGRLKEMMEQTDKLIKKAASYFESLDLNPLNNTFYEKFTRHISAKYGLECRSEVYYFPPDVGLRYCTELDYKKFMQMHGHMAQLQYNLYRRSLPFGLDTEPCPGFSNAIAETAVLASGTPRHLYRLRVLANETLGTDNSLNRLFRMAVHTVPAIMQYYIQDKFVADVLDRRIDFKNLNCGYWKLQLKYAGVEPPVKRNELHFDPDYKFYQGLHPGKSSTIKLLSEVLGLQLYRSFCLASDQYRPGNPEYPLSNCDYCNSTHAGQLIKEMMKLGATRHWRDVLFIATGERKLSGIGVMEYFAPLYKWLREWNKILDLDVGWKDESNKCISD